MWRKKGEREWHISQSQYKGIKQVPEFNITKMSQKNKR